MFANSGAVTYQWFLNGGVISGATNYYYFASQSGDYNVVCTDSNDCEVEAAIFDVVANTNELFFMPALSISPIPFITTIDLQFSRPQNSFALLSIYNSIGELIVQKQIHLENQSFNLSELQKGIYLVSIRSDNEIWNKKIVK